MKVKKEVGKLKWKPESIPMWLGLLRYDIIPQRWKAADFFLHNHVAADFSLSVFSLLLLLLLLLWENYYCVPSSIRRSVADAPDSVVIPSAAAAFWAATAAFWAAVAAFWAASAAVFVVASSSQNGVQHKQGLWQCGNYDDNFNKYIYDDNFDKYVYDDN